MATFTTVTKSGTAETVLWWEAYTDSDSVASVIIIGRWVWVDDQSVSEDAGLSVGNVDLQRQYCCTCNQ
eukprot:m.144352 g.144352  ORF g.144352 m.144352 type:complete len:69 (-) comp11600_c0_seq14:627-833(-)